MLKSQYSQSQSAAREINAAATQADAEKAFDRLIDTFDTKYPKAVECLTKDQAKLPSFFDFPNEDWLGLGTSNPIESTLATVLMRTDKTRGCVSATRVLSVVFKLVQSAQKY